MEFKNLDIKIRYRSDIDNFPRDFLVPVLEKSLEYKRGVGYFSTSSLIELSTGLFDMYKRGGKIQVVCSPKLDKADIEAINYGYKTREDVFEKSLLNEIIEPINYFDSERLNLVATMIAEGVMDFKIAFLENENGISLYHEKLAIFIDSEGNRISYAGSMNESYNGMQDNFESIYTFCSWKDNSQLEAVKIAEYDFDQMWENRTQKLHIVEFPKLAIEKLMKFKKNNVDMTIDERQYGYREFLKCHMNFKIPEEVKMRDYQKNAVNKWFDNENRGIFNMSTGSGKTYTALYAMVKLAEKINEQLAIFIVCPYIHLVSQWEEDVIKWGPPPIIAHSKSPNREWESDLQISYRRFRKDDKPFICITTMDTFCGDKIQKYITRFESKQKILLIVDEAHNFGSKRMIDKMPENVQYRIGLSATIKRHMDKTGTQKLFEFFGDECINYGLEEAINDGNLVHYEYHPYLVYLSSEELEEYGRLTRKLKKYIIIKNGKTKISEAGKPTIYQRTRLLAGAINKIPLLMELINQYKKDNNILVYCGATSMEDEITGEEKRQIDLITENLKIDMGMSVKRFTAEEDLKERESIKKYFSQGMYQVITAIKCLDEGVNIPGIKTAFIMSSSRNPKEFVQRRGRLLRKFDNKKIAVIYDFITLPRDLDEVVYGDFEEDKSIVIGEMARIEEFARLSDNPEKADFLLNKIMEAYDTYLDIEEETKKMEDYYAE